MLKNFLSSVCAGVLISIGGCVFLACENRYVGAVLFSVALLCICLKGYALYTGRVGYIIESHKKSDFAALAVILIGNLLTTFLLGMLVRVSMPQLGETAAAICSGKLTQAFWQTLVRAFFCGILMYLAVSTYKEKNTVLGILFCVPVFILSGFEHSIADMFYLGASGIFSLSAALFMLAVVIGNSLGGIFLPALTLIGGEKMKANKAEIAVFVSGGGTNLQALIDAQKSGIIEHGEIKLVVSSNPNAYALERAAKAGIKGVTVSKKEFGSQAAVEEK